MKFKYSYTEDREWLETEQKRERDVFYDGELVANICCEYNDFDGKYFYEILPNPNSKIPWGTLAFKSKYFEVVDTGFYAEEKVSHAAHYSSLKECKEAILEEIQCLE